jgi:hypothetical protein
MAKLWPNGYNCGDACLLNAINMDVMTNHTDLYPDAAAHSIRPGLQALKEAVQGVTGLTITNYVLIDMFGFRRANQLNAGGSSDRRQNALADRWQARRRQRCSRFY